MKVSDLIEILSALDRDLPVIVRMEVYDGLVDLEEDFVKESIVRPSEDDRDVYVRAGEAWPGSIKAVVIG